jgi:hypothetical protein
MTKTISTEEFRREVKTELSRIKVAYGNMTISDIETANVLEKDELNIGDVSSIYRHMRDYQYYAESIVARTEALLKSVDVIFNKLKKENKDETNS